jgi:hypothetical protein
MTQAPALLPGRSGAGFYCYGKESSRILRAGLHFALDFDPINEFGFMGRARLSEGTGGMVFHKMSRF